MAQTINVSFPGGKRVDAEIRGEVIHTDQSVRNGGEGAAPEPFTLFLSSIATCAGIYALEFCKTRELSTEGLALKLHLHKDDEKKMYTKMTIELVLPEGFPEKYHKAIVRSVNLCSVKKHIMNAPEFETVVTPA